MPKVSEGFPSSSSNPTSGSQREITICVATFSSSFASVYGTGSVGLFASSEVWVLEGLVPHCRDLQVWSKRGIYSSWICSKLRVLWIYSIKLICIYVVLFLGWFVSNILREVILYMFWWVCGVVAWFTPMPHYVWSNINMREEFVNYKFLYVRKQLLKRLLLQLKLVSLKFSEVVMIGSLWDQCMF